MRTSHRLSLASAFLAVATLAACDGFTPPGSPVERPLPMPSDWQFDLSEQFPEAPFPELAASVNGIDSRKLMFTETGILTTFTHDSSGISMAGDAVLLIDYDTGEPIWQLDKPHIFCATPADPDSLVCTYAAGDGWEAMRIASDTGKILHTWPLDVTSSWGVAEVGDGLLIVDEPSPRRHTGLTLVDATGAAVWQEDLAHLVDRIPVTERTVNGQEHSVMFETELISQETYTVFRLGELAVLTDGATTRPRLVTCTEIIADDTGFLCSSYQNITHFDATGAIDWSRDDTRLTYHSLGKSTPIGVKNPYQDDEELVLLDPVTGEQIATLDVPHADYVSGTVSDERYFLSNSEEAFLLDSSTGQVLWETSDPELVKSYRAFAVGEVLVDPGYPTRGYDLATGEFLWEFDTDMDLFTRDHALYGTGFRSLTKYLLPR